MDIARIKQATGTAVLCALSVGLAVWPFDAVLAAQGQAQVEPSSTAPQPSGAPVALDGETIYVVDSSFGAFTAKERADAGARRIRRIADDPFYDPALLTIAASGASAEIRYGDAIIGVVTAEDARLRGAAPESTAASLVQTIKAAVTRYRERRMPAARLRAVIDLLVATLLLVLGLVGADHLRRKKPTVSDDGVIPAGPTPESRGPAGRAPLPPLWEPGLRLLRNVIRVVLVVAYLLVTFSVFPLTRAYARSALDYLLDPLQTLWQGFAHHISDFAFIVVVVLLSRYLLRGIRSLLMHAAAGKVPGLSPEWAPLHYKILRLSIIALTIILIYPHIPGSSTDAFKGIGILAGALFTVGGSGAAGNVMGGLVVTLAGTFHVGDLIQIGEVTGVVVETTMMTTRLHTIKNEMVTFPNAAVFAAHVINYSTKARSEGLILHSEVTIGYDVPWRKVHALLLDAARRTEHVLEAPAPFVLQRALNDSYVTYEINAYTRHAVEMSRIYSALHQHMQDCFNEAGVEILSPAYTFLRDGNASTIPASYHKADETRDVFRVRLEGEPRTSDEDADRHLVGHHR